MPNERIEEPSSDPFSQKHVDAAVRALGRLGEKFMLMWATSPELQIVVLGDIAEAFQRADSFRRSTWEEEWQKLYWALPHWNQRLAFAALSAFYERPVFVEMHRDALRAPDEGRRSATYGAKLEALRSVARLEDDEWRRLNADYVEGTAAILRTRAQSTARATTS